MPPGLPPIQGIEHQIDLIHGASLPNHAPYRTNPAETQEIMHQVQELLDRGYIRESLSPCVVPIILVPKKDGTSRMCVDCRGINNITIRYRHPIPDRGKGVPSFDEMMDIALLEVDFDDPTTNVRGRRALAIAKPTLRDY